MFNEWPEKIENSWIAEQYVIKVSGNKTPLQLLALQFSSQVIQGGFLFRT